jgi:hypothetical protein
MNKTTAILGEDEEEQEHGEACSERNHDEELKP